jgi:MFS family permease
VRPQRWLRIIPAALVMYTIAYVDRTNISLALDPALSSMTKDLVMDDRLKGEAAGIFFLGYVLLQIPGGYWASRWSPRKLISLLLVAWGGCAAGCGLAQGFRQFELMRFLLGVAESGVFPATLVLLTHWFPRQERARANAYWNLCQPLAIAGTAPLTSWLLGAYGWRTMLVLEGVLPFLWLPLWWLSIRDHPRQARWISPPEREFLETTLAQENAELREARFEPRQTAPGQLWFSPALLPVLVLVGMYFLQNCAAYGCMTFFTVTLKGHGFTPLQYGLLFGLPYAVTALFMVLNSRHSDRTQERRGHVAVAYFFSGLSLVLAIWLQNLFWVSYAFLCLAIPGPFAAMGPFWAIPGELLSGPAQGVAVGVINAFGNTGGFAGPYLVGWLKGESHGLALPFSLLGSGMVLAAGLAFLVPKPHPLATPAPGAPVTLPR